jgi:hypothetical protein
VTTAGDPGHLPGQAADAECGLEGLELRAGENAGDVGRNGVPVVASATRGVMLDDLDQRGGPVRVDRAGTREALLQQVGDGRARPLGLLRRLPGVEALAEELAQAASCVAAISSRPEARSGGVATPGAFDAPARSSTASWYSASIWSNRRSCSGDSCSCRNTPAYFSRCSPTNAVTRSFPITPFFQPGALN